MKIISVTPAGRRQYLEILVPYLLRDRDIITEHHFWVNTNNPEDLQYIKDLCNTYHSFFKFIENPRKVVLDTPSAIFNNIYKFHQLCQDEDTIYIRLDDDICWIDENFFRTITKFRVDNTEYFLVGANVINNGLCSMLHQKLGIMKSGFYFDGKCTGSAWRPQNSNSIEVQHRVFIDHVNNKTTDIYKGFDKWIITDVQEEKTVNGKEWYDVNSPGRFSINSICWFGKDYKSFNGAVGVDEEQWLTYDYPRTIKKFNAICGGALVSHFSFCSQREYLEKTDLLSLYKGLSLKI